MFFLLFRRKIRILRDVQRYVRVAFRQRFRFLGRRRVGRVHEEGLLFGRESVLELGERVFGGDFGAAGTRFAAGRVEGKIASPETGGGVLLRGRRGLRSPSMILRQW